MPTLDAPPPPPVAGSPLPAARSTPFGRREIEKTRRFLIYAAALLVSGVIGVSLAYFPPLLFVGGLVALAGGVAIFAYPYLGLLLYALLFILRPGEVYPVLGALHLERIIGVVTLLGIFLGMLRRTGQISLDMSTQSKWLWLFTFAIVASIPFSYWFGHSLSTLIDMMKIIAFYIMIVYLVDTRRKLKVFVVLYMLLMAYLGVDSLITYYSGGSVFRQGIDRAVGTTSAGGAYNELGTTMASIFPFFLVFTFMSGRWWKKGIAASGALMSVWAMVLTGSRASMLGFAAGALYLWWRSRNRLLTGILGLCVVFAGVLVMPDQYKTRYSTITKSKLDGSSKGRVDAWLTGVEMVIDRPLFGVGAGCFGTAHALGYSSGSRMNWLESHSLYIQVVTELGLFGAFAFFGLLASFLRLNRRTARAIAKLGRSWRWENGLMIALFAGFVVLIISGIFGHSLYRRTWYVYAALGLAMYRIYRAHADASEDAPA